MAKILLVEDDLSFAQDLIECLQRERHAIDHAARLSEVQAFLEMYPYDILILDWELPDGSGAAYCRTLTTRGFATPILMLTARANVGDRIEGLDNGAVDYVCKPCFPTEICARIRAILRREPISTDMIILNGVTIDVIGRLIEIDGIEVKLSPTEFDISVTLARQAGSVMTPESLVARCSVYSSKLSRSSLKVYMSNVRKKFIALGYPCPIEWRDTGYVWLGSNE